MLMPQLEDAPTPLTTATAESLKQSVVSIMIALSGEPALQVQVGEAIAIMAEADFPDQWQNLVDVRSLSLVVRRRSAHARHAQQLTSQLTTDNFVVNNAVLQTAHSIFRRYAGCLFDR